MTLTTVGPRWADAASFSIGWSGHRCSACAVISRGAGTCRQGQTCRGSWTQQHLKMKFNTIDCQWKSYCTSSRLLLKIQICFTKVGFILLWQASREEQSSTNKQEFSLAKQHSSLCTCIDWAGHQVFQFNSLQFCLATGIYSHLQMFMPAKSFCPKV